MQASNPIHVLPSGAVHRLERLSFNGAAEGGYDEKYLQKILFENPSLLPVGEIDSNYSRLIPVCRELYTGVGPVDLLYVTEEGGLVVVETKLWRNPESRREVIGQILDYAKELAKWDCARLSLQVKKAVQSRHESLYHCVSQFNPALMEKGFTDAVSRNLAQGNFLLMIVGDGIREGVEELTGFLDRLGRLAFTFGLVEMGLFRMPEGGLLVQPRVLAKTVIVKRTVITIDDNRKAVIKEEGEEQEAATGDSARGQFLRDFWSDFIKNHLTLDDTSQEKPQSNRSANIYLPQPPSGSQAWISAYLAPSKNLAGVYLRFARGAYGEEAAKHLQLQEKEIEQELGVPVDFSTVDGVYWIHSSTKYKSLSDATELDTVYRFLSDRLNRYVNVLRPRLKAISDEIG